MNYVILLVMTSIILGTGCISQSTAKVPEEKGTPAAMVGKVATSEPTNGVKKGPNLPSTPVVDQGRGVKVTPNPAPATPLTATVAIDQWSGWRGNGYEFRYPRA